MDDFFTVEGEASDELEIRGDARRIKWIAPAMTRGRVFVAGNAGMHLGAYMKGGTIEVSGNVSDWLGAEMSGGLIRIRGNAGGQVGAAYRGSLTGMKDGTILIDGTAGLEVGMRMKRGIIAVGGTVRDFAGLLMRGGTIVLGGGAELRTGAWMIRGTIVSLMPIRLLPTFSYAVRYNPTFMRLYAKRLASLGFIIPYEDHEGAYQRYSGDTSVPGKGEILVWRRKEGTGTACQHAVLGLVAALYDYDWKEAERRFRLAMARDSISPEVDATTAGFRFSIETIRVQVGLVVEPFGYTENPGSWSA